MTDDQKKSIEEIVGHLGAALSQMASTDDAIIIGHIQAAHAEAAKLMSGGKSANTVHPIFQPILDAIAPELEECACGRTYEPVDGNGEDVDMCQTCRENAAVVAYERSLDSYYGGGAPVTIEEQHNAAWEEKRGAR